MFKIVMVTMIVEKRLVDMPKDKHLGFTEAAFRAQAYNRKNDGVYYYIVDEETGEKFEV